MPDAPPDAITRRLNRLTRPGNLMLGVIAAGLAGALVQLSGLGPESLQQLARFACGAATALLVLSALGGLIDEDDADAPAHTATPDAPTRPAPTARPRRRPTTAWLARGISVAFVFAVAPVSIWQAIFAGAALLLILGLTAMTPAERRGMVTGPASARVATGATSTTEPYLAVLESVSDGARQDRAVRLHAPSLDDALRQARAHEPAPGDAYRLIALAPERAAASVLLESGESLAERWLNENDR